VASTKTRTPVPTATSTQTPTSREEKCADINRNGRVDLDDLLLMTARTWGRFDSDYDLNDDHRVDVWDVLMVMRDLGRHCHGAPRFPAGDHHRRW
jgi:hypothetical protein